MNTARYTELKKSCRSESNELLYMRETLMCSFIYKKDNSHLKDCKNPALRVYAIPLRRLFIYKTHGSYLHCCVITFVIHHNFADSSFLVTVFAGKLMDVTFPLIYVVFGCVKCQADDSWTTVPFTQLEKSTKISINHKVLNTTYSTFYGFMTMQQFILTFQDRVTKLIQLLYVLSLHKVCRIYTIIYTLPNMPCRG